MLWVLGNTSSASEPESTPPPDDKNNNDDTKETQPPPPPTAQDPDPASTTPIMSAATNLATPTSAAGLRNHYNLIALTLTHKSSQYHTSLNVNAQQNTSDQKCL